MPLLPILTLNWRQTAAKNEIISSCYMLSRLYVYNNNELDDTNNAVDDDDDKIRTKRNINIKSQCCLKMSEHVV